MKIRLISRESDAFTVDFTTKSINDIIVLKYFAMFIYMYKLPTEKA